MKILRFIPGLVVGVSIALLALIHACNGPEEVKASVSADSLSVNAPAPALALDSTDFYLGMSWGLQGLPLDSVQKTFPLTILVDHLKGYARGATIRLQSGFDFFRCDPCQKPTPRPTGNGGGESLKDSARRGDFPPMILIDTTRGITNYYYYYYGNRSYVVFGDTARKGQELFPALTMTVKDDTTKKKRNFPQTKIWGGAFGGVNLGGYYTGIEIGPAEIEFRGATGGRNLRDSILRSEYSNVSGRVALVNKPNLRVAVGATGTQLYQRELIRTTASFEDFVDGRRFAGTDTLTGIVSKTDFYAGPFLSGRVKIGQKASIHVDADYQLRAGGTAEGPNGFLNAHARVVFEPFPGAILEAGAGYQFDTPVVSGGINLDLNKIFTQN